MEILSFVSAFLLGTILHYIIQKVFIFYKKFDDINYRSSHKNLATRTGGIGIFTTLFIISLFYYSKGVEIFDYSLLIPLGIMFFIGVYDDFYYADFKLKFFLQVIVSKILIDQGYMISNYHGLFGLYEIPWFIAQLSTVFVFIVVVNAINFIDGIDGLAISEVIKTIIIIELFSVNLTPLSTLGFIVICSMLSLYYYNFKNNNKVFLGDGGSMVLGTLVTIYLFYLLGDDYNLNERFSINKTLFSVLILIYPLFDLLRVFLIRIKAGKSPFEADQNHIHHFLLRKLKSMLAADIVILLFSILIFSFYLL